MVLEIEMTFSSILYNAARPTACESPIPGPLPRSVSPSTTILSRSSKPMARSLRRPKSLGLPSRLRSAIPCYYMQTRRASRMEHSGFEPHCKAICLLTTSRARTWTSEVCSGVSSFLWSALRAQELLSFLPRYSDGAKTGLPGDPSSADPGPGISNITDVDGTTTLVPLVPSSAPNATRTVSVTVSFRSTADGRFLGFINTTSWEPLSGTTTLLSVQKNATGYAPVGESIGAGDQLFWMEDSIQVLDFIVVCILLFAAPFPALLGERRKGQLGRWRSSVPLAWPSPLDVREQFTIRVSAAATLSDVLLGHYETEWAVDQDVILAKG
jgi:hypothetical protein